MLNVAKWQNGKGTKGGVNRFSHSTGIEICVRKIFFVPLQMKSRKQVSSDNESVRCKSPDRDLIICDVAHARHTENKLSSVLA